MVLTASFLTVIAMVFDVQHHRVGWAFVMASTAMLVAFAGAAFGVTATIPLEAALDARGVTFAGRCTPWAAVENVSVQPVGRSRFQVHIGLRDGSCVSVGPALHARAEELSAAIGVWAKAQQRV
jgi:hypothetical protein